MSWAAGPVALVVTGRHWSASTSKAECTSSAGWPDSPVSANCAGSGLAGWLTATADLQPALTSWICMPLIALAGPNGWRRWLGWLDWLHFLLGRHTAQRNLSTTVITTEATTERAWRRAVHHNIARGTCALCPCKKKLLPHSRDACQLCSNGWETPLWALAFTGWMLSMGSTRLTRLSQE